MPDEVKAEPAARLRDSAVRGQLDQVGGLLLVQVVTRCSKSNALKLKRKPRNSTT